MSQPGGVMFSAFGTSLGGLVGFGLGYVAWGNVCDPVVSTDILSLISPHRSCPIMGEQTQQEFAFTVAGVVGFLFFVYAIYASNRPSQG